MIPRFSWLLPALFGALLCSRAATQETISFNLQVRPILSDRCWACHGPDENKRKAKLRLDTKEGALASKDGKFIIKPNDANASEVYKRLVTSDAEEKMPPADSHLTVSNDEIATIKRWIEQGASWEKHWAYVPVRVTEPPQVEGAFSVCNEIDRFILARLQKEGLNPAPEAQKER